METSIQFPPGSSMSGDPAAPVPDEFKRVRDLRARLSNEIRSGNYMVRSSTAALVAEMCLDQLSPPVEDAVLIPSRDWQVARDQLLTLRRRMDAAEAELNAISYFLRQEFGYEIASGQHDNLPLSEIVIAYLRRCPHSGQPLEEAQESRERMKAAKFAPPIEGGER